MDDDSRILQRFIDTLFRRATFVQRLDAVVLAESLDMAEELLGIVLLLPPGRYDRARLCDQINSAITAHGWSRRWGTVD